MSARAQAEVNCQQVGVTPSQPCICCRGVSTATTPTPSHPPPAQTHTHTQAEASLRSLCEKRRLVRRLTITQHDAYVARGERAEMEYVEGRGWQVERVGMPALLASLLELLPRHVLQRLA